MTKIEDIKLITLGNSTVGKSSFMIKYIDNSFTFNYTTTLGVDFKQKKIKLKNGKDVRLRIFDTAGQERYRALTKMFYKDANAAVLVYDITRKDSFEEIQNYWSNQIKESSPPGIILAVAANKSDLIDHEAVDEEQARKFAEDLGAIFVSTTATQIDPVNDLFIQIAKKYTGSNEIKIKEDDDAQEQPNTDDKKGTVKLTSEKSNDKNNRRRGCC